MFNPRVTSALLAGTLILGSTAIAFAESDHADRDMAAKGTVVASQSAKPAAPTDNPFALYREPGEPSNAGTPIAPSHIATAKNYIMMGSPGENMDRDTVR